MKRLISVLLVCALPLLGGCAMFSMPRLDAGIPEAQVLEKLGAPTNRYQDGADTLLEYRKGPWGQYTYMARLGPHRRLLTYEQVLTTEKFALLEPRRSTKQDVLRTIGAPSFTSYLSLSDLEVWTYPYKEANVWDSLMHVHFDRRGVVERLQNARDPRFEPDMLPFGL